MPARIQPAGERRDCRCPRVKHDHGTSGGYGRDGCRCVECRSAARARRRLNYRRATVNRWAGRAEIVDAAGTRRRLQALAALGHSAAAVGVRLGCGFRFVVELRQSQGTVLRSTAERVAVVYEQLSAVVPAGQYPDLTRLRARAKGWPPPLAWEDESIDDPSAVPDFGGDDAGLVDPVAVEQALAGRPVALTRRELRAAVRLGHERGLTASMIADRTGTTDRSVWRILAGMDGSVAA